MREKDGDEDNEAMGNRGNGRLKPATETVQTDRHTKRHAESEREKERERDTRHMQRLSVFSSVNVSACRSTQ